MRDPVEITFGGRTYEMVPDFRAFSAIEKELGASLPMTLALHEAERLSGLALGQIVLEGLKSAPLGDDDRMDASTFQVEDVAKRLFEIGIAGDEVRLPVREFLEALCYTPEQIQKKREAAAAAEADLFAAMSSNATAPQQ